MQPSPAPLKMNELHTVQDSGLWEWIAVLLRRRLRFQVRGRSMLPLLDQGDEVFVDARKKVTKGDVIVLRHPYRIDIVLVKYVAFINEHGAVYVLGVNLVESTDSRSFGWVEPHQIYGCVHSRFRP